MIFFDVTKTGGAAHRSGLTRVSARLGEALGPAMTEFRWSAPGRSFRREDWFLTAELFSEEERPGITAFLAAQACRLAAIFHDAIPLKHPDITWPQSVARHPGYMKLLARFDRVWAVSDASRRELLEFWHWQGLERVPAVEVLALGADFGAGPRVLNRRPPPRAPAPVPRLLSVGILEPRKNQLFLLEVCAALWADGLAFELHLAGRVNPHFGRPIVTRIKALQRQYPAWLHHHESAGDAELGQLYAGARATAFPTIAEGCGLPLLEALWLGVPCVCSDLPVLRENANDGGCLPVPPNEPGAWQSALRGVLTDDALHAKLTAEAIARPLPTWAGTAQTIRRALG